MSKFSIFSVLLVGSLLVAPAVTANYAISAKKAHASDVISTSSSSSDLASSMDSSRSLDFSSSSPSSVQSASTVSISKSKKIITDVKPVKLNVQADNWWLDTGTLTGGNSDTSGIDAINSQIQAKLLTQCPNIYDTATKTINEINLTSCTPINNLPVQKIAVIDSGVNPRPDMAGFIDQASSWNFFTSVEYPTICTATSPLNFLSLVQGNVTTEYCKEKGTQSDTDTHGSVVSLTAIRSYENSLLKYKVKIVPYSLRTLDTVNISEAIDEVVRAGDIKTINLSIGTPYNLSYVETSVNDANAAGISLYASSGNCAVYSSLNCDYNGNIIQDLPQEADNAPDYPASYANAVMVGSTNYSDNSIPGIIRATYSNFATALRSNFVTAPVGNSGIILPCFLNCQGVVSYAYRGTSFAAPQAAAMDGLIAKYSELMKTNLGQPNEKVLVSTDTPKVYVTTNTTDVLTAGNDLETGTGLINLKKISDKIVTQLQTLNIPVSSSSSSSSISSSSLVSSSSSSISSATSSSSSSVSVSNSSSSSSSSAPVLSANIPGNIFLSSDNLSYIVDFTATNFVPTPGANHVHFYYDTEASTVVNKMYSSTAPYTLTVSTKPAGATQLCIIVANAAHQIIPNSGVCKLLPIIPVSSSSSSVSSSSSNVSSISSSQPASTSSSSTQVSSASSSQISPSSQAVSSAVAQNSSAVSSSSSSAISTPVVSSGGGVITIITGIISNVINSITGANANLNGNVSQVSSASSSIALVSSQSSRSQEIAIKEQGIKLAEDAAFVGLINNQSGFGIKENGVKSPEVNLEIQSDFGIKEQVVKTGSNQETSSNSSVVASNEACKKGIKEDGLKLTDSEIANCPTPTNSECRKGWDGSVKGGSVFQDSNPNAQRTEGKVKGKIVISGDNGMKSFNQDISNCQSLSSECKKGINENGLKLTDNEALDCSFATNADCRKGWDSSVKGGNVCDQDCDSQIGGISGGAIAGKIVEKATSGLKDTLKTQVRIANPSSQTDCVNPNLIVTQSDISSSNDFSKYIPVILASIVGIAGVAVATGYFFKIRNR